ncbi:azurin [Xylophilus sp.]|uniref:azurin n=1 Tax=Xylophilus sp. TaxID=2653893 RepID=UPI0013B89126|nr:azurin [Xylophilus sp.]KAF1048983.1 MAG: Azurin iso-1 [Xylophilus sp.]
MPLPTAISLRTLVTASLLALAAGPLFAATCEAVVEANDAMQFNTKDIAVDKSCKQFKLTLRHTGKLPKTAMGHNVLIAKAADLQAVANDGIAAGAAQDYVKAGDARVVAHTKLVGGGESDSVPVPVAKLAPKESYAFFCSFPGHSALMKGTVTLK